MTPPLEHDYIGLSEFSSMENSDKFSSMENSDKFSSMENSDKLSSTTFSLSTEDEPKIGAHPPALNLKAIELRLGLPGSQSPEPEDGPGLTLGLPRSLVSGTKRGFSDAPSISSSAASRPPPSWPPSSSSSTLTPATSAPPSASSPPSPAHPSAIHVEKAFTCTNKIVEIKFQTGTLRRAGFHQI